MKIEHVEDDPQNERFRLRAGGRAWTMPYAKCQLVPTPDDPVDRVVIDEELGCDFFTYWLESGAEDSVPMDRVLDANGDPDFLQRVLMYRLTCEVLDAVEEEGLGIRELARLLETSPSQIYRLLDTTNANKSLGQMLTILHHAGRTVRLDVRRFGRAMAGAASDSSSKAGSAPYPSARSAPPDPPPP